MEESNKEFNTGYISAIIGSLIKIKGLENHFRLHDLVKISNYPEIKTFTKYSSINLMRFLKRAYQ